MYCLHSRLTLGHTFICDKADAAKDYKGNKLNFITIYHVVPLFSSLAYTILGSLPSKGLQRNYQRGKRSIRGRAIAESQKGIFAVNNCLVLYFWCSGYYALHFNSKKFTLVCPPQEVRIFIYNFTVCQSKQFPDM